MTDQVKFRWDPYSERRRIARSQSRMAEPSRVQPIPDGNLSFTASDVEVARMRNFPQPASGKAWVTLSGTVRWYTDGSTLYDKVGLDTATVNGGGAGFNGLYAGTDVVSGLNISDPSTVFQIFYSAGGAPTSGSLVLSLTVPGQSAQTVTLTFSQLQASAAASVLAIQSGIAALTGVGAGQVHVKGAGTTSSPWLVSLYGTGFGTTTSISSQSFAGTGTQTISLTTGLIQNTNITKITDAVLLSFDMTSLVIANATGGTLRLFVGSQFVDVAWNVALAALKTALEGLSNVGTGNAVIVGAGTTGSPYYITFTPQSPAGGQPVNPTRPVLSVGTVGTQSSASSLTGSSPLATLAYLGGSPEQPWDVCWHIASNSTAGVLEVGSATARRAAMKVEPLALLGVPAPV